MISIVRNFSIKTQLTILCLIILIPLLVFQGMEIRGKYRTLYDHEVQANLEIARATRAMFVSYVNNLLRVEAALVVGFSQKELITRRDLSRLQRFRRPIWYRLQFKLVEPPRSCPGQ